MIDTYCDYRNKMLVMMEPANTIIQKCGGVNAVAELVGRSSGRVRRWTKSKAEGGTDGLIPADCQQILFRKAAECGLTLTPSDFFLDEDVKSALALDLEAVG